MFVFLCSFVCVFVRSSSVCSLVSLCLCVYVCLFVRLWC